MSISKYHTKVPVYYSMMIRTLIALCVLLATWAAATSVALPDIPARMGVDEHTATEATSALVRVLRRDVGAEVVPVPLVTPGLAGSLDGDMARLIAELGDAEYGVSGEVSRAGDDYRLTVLLTHRESRSVSDLLSVTFTPDDAYTGIRELTAALQAFLVLPDGPREGASGLFVSSVPVGAEVRIDNRTVGTSGELDIVMLEPGRYTIEVRKDGYLPELRRIDVRGSDVELLRVVLTPLTGGSISIDSVPAADVFLENEYLGRTPLSIPALAGAHDLRLERLGFRSQVVPVLVRDYRVSRVVAELEPLTDLVVVWDAPPGTVVEIEGNTYVSYAFDVRPGLRSIVVTKPGEEPVERLVAFPARGVIELDPDTLRLTVLR